jgi:hypothetical protein
MSTEPYYIKTAAPAFLLNNRLQTVAVRKKEATVAAPNEPVYRHTLLRGEERGRQQVVERGDNVLRIEAAEGGCSLLCACPGINV